MYHAVKTLFSGLGVVGTPRERTLPNLAPRFNQALAHAGDWM
jgi:hypothetical protein